MPRANQSVLLPFPRVKRVKPLEILVGAITKFAGQVPIWTAPTYALVFHMYGGSAELGTWLACTCEHAINAKDFREALIVKRVAQRYVDHTGRLPNLSRPWWEWGKNCTPRHVERKAVAA